MAVIHIQQGGSTRELYLHIHDDRAEAEECRKSCESGAYHVSDDIVTKCKLTPAVQDLIDQLLTDAANLVAGEI